LFFYSSFLFLSFVAGFFDTSIVATECAHDCVTPELDWRLNPASLVERRTFHSYDLASQKENVYTLD